MTVKIDLVGQAAAGPDSDDEPDEDKSCIYGFSKSQSPVTVKERRKKVAFNGLRAAPDGRPSKREVKKKLSKKIMSLGK